MKYIKTFEDFDFVQDDYVVVTTNKFDYNKDFNNYIKNTIGIITNINLGNNNEKYHEIKYFNIPYIFNRMFDMDCLYLHGSEIRKATPKEIKLYKQYKETNKYNL